MPAEEAHGGVIERAGGSLRDGHSAVRYGLPLYPVGEVAAPLVAIQVARIFAERKRRLQSILALQPAPTSEVTPATC